MTPTNYEQNVLKTESTDLIRIYERINNDRMIRLLHAGLGMSSELSELIDAYANGDNNAPDWVNVAEEGLDCNWYCTVAVNALGFDHEEISKFEKDGPDHPQIEKHSITALGGAIAALTCCVGDFNDQIKKHLFYGRELNLEKMKQSLQQICMAIAGICFVSGTTIEQGRETNIAKLRKRYPDKFTEDAALNRNLEAERKILEDGLK